MQHLCSRLLRESRISPVVVTCQIQVRFFALLRIEPHNPPLVRAPVNSFEFSLATVLPRRHTTCVSFVTAGVNPSYDLYASFTAWTTRVSNPACSPRFRFSASVSDQLPAFATGVPPYIYAFHHYTWNSSNPFSTLVLRSPRQFPS